MKIDVEYNDILSMVTHDLKSPLSATMGALELLDDENLDEEDRVECIKIAKLATKNALKLAEDILVMAKYEAGREHCEIAEVKNLKKYFNEIENTFRYQMRVKNHYFYIYIDDNLPTVYWDIEKIKYHVINNIISNAIKFTQEGGKIYLGAFVKDDNVIIEIKDNGIGIEDSKKDTIFQKYDTHDNQKVFKGTGLGLYNAKCFVELHKGSIEVINGLDKKGVGFKISLPIS
ncbi:MAG: HAMP domain-containing histidine kinase [Campylobacterales bacterium]|nr:HAMP domain-containing histidine kinase [Campylobacterales bacterium]